LLSSVLLTLEVKRHIVLWQRLSLVGHHLVDSVQSVT